MDIAFNSGSVEIWTKSAKNCEYIIFIKNNRVLAKKLNKVLKYYSADTKFKDFEEPGFRFSAAQIKQVATTSRKLKVILQQIGLC